MSWRTDIKNKINQIKNNNVEIIKEFPTKDNFNKNSYMKYWVTALFVDISGYTKICEEKDDIYVGKLIRTFHEGILTIMKAYKLKHIQIQGDGIFGVLAAPNKNDLNNVVILNCAKEIQGFLTFFWKMADYKISIASKEELMIVVGQEDAREVVFAGGAVNAAKKLMETTTIKNVIFLNDIFEFNNDKVLWNNEQNSSYISGKDHNISYSNWYMKGWEK